MKQRTEGFTGQAGQAKLKARKEEGERVRPRATLLTQDAFGMLHGVKAGGAECQKCGEKVYLTEEKEGSEGDEWLRHG